MGQLKRCTIERCTIEGKRKKAGELSPAFLICMPLVVPRYVKRLGAERVTTAAGLFRIWIVELESSLFDAFVVVDRGAVQEQVALFVDNHHHAVLVSMVIFGFIVVIGNVQTVVESGATTTGNGDSETSSLSVVAFGDKSLHFLCRFFSYRNAHLYLHLQMKWIVGLEEGFGGLPAFEYLVGLSNLGARIFRNMRANVYSFLSLIARDYDLKSFEPVFAGISQPKTSKNYISLT